MVFHIAKNGGRSGFLDAALALVRLGKTENPHFLDRSYSGFGSPKFSSF
jgi:hypothetical protein